MFGLFGTNLDNRDLFKQMEGKQEVTNKRKKRIFAWKPSHREEIISVLWLIAAIESIDKLPKLTTACLFVKAIMDTICALRHANRETDEEEEKNE